MASRFTIDAALGGATQHQVFQDARHVVSIAGQRLKFAPCEALCEPSVTKFHDTGTQVCRHLGAQSIAATLLYLCAHDPHMSS